MKKLLLPVLFLVLGMNLRAQNEKNIVVDANAEVRKASGFTAIEISGAIDLYLSQGSEEAVAISGSSEEIKSRIRTEVKNGTLHIYFDSKGINWKTWGNNKMKAYVTFKKLARLESSGACNVRATEAIRGDELTVELSGASDFSGELNITKLKLNVSGASNMRVSGNASSANIDASGACVFKGFDLKTDMCRIDASGASVVQVTVNKELNASASGGSSISYKGPGMIRDISSSGGASIKHRQE